MTTWLSILLNSIQSALQTRRDLAFENLLLHQQLAMLEEKGGRPRLSSADRSFWVLISNLWPKWRAALHVVRPAVSGYSPTNDIEDLVSVAGRKTASKSPPGKVIDFTS